MNVFEAVKQNLTTRQAAELYGIQVSRHGMAVCPFHNDKNPSMKVDKRFHCFACQADGDAVDFVSCLFGLPSWEAAVKLADDFGISYDNRQKHRIKPHIREPTPEQRYRQEESRCYKVLSDYFHHLRIWKQQYENFTRHDGAAESVLQCCPGCFRAVWKKISAVRRTGMGNQSGCGLLFSYGNAENF